MSMLLGPVLMLQRVGARPSGKVRSQVKSRTLDPAPASALSALKAAPAVPC